MFGYVKPYVPELKVAQYEKYRAAYCGLCRAMGKVTGQVSRLSLSYDPVYLAAVRMILEGIAPEFEPFRCGLHAVKPRLLLRDNAALDYAAACSAVLTEAKNRDDLADERGFKKLGSALLSPLTRHFARRGEGALFSRGLTAEEEVFLRLRELSRLEAENCPSADETAEVFGGVLGFLFRLGLDGERAETAYELGRSTGRFLYLCDAADDLARDAAAGRYNPLLAGWGSLALENGAMSPLVKDSLSAAFPLDLERLGEAAERLDALSPRHEMLPIVKNIIYLGLPAAMKRVLSGRDGGERKGWEEAE